MLALALVLLLALVLGGAGFAVHALWWIALLVLALWLLGFVFRSGGRAGGSRWYRW
ncbi:hydrophobic protein [Kitasatospora sp. NPDC015120]|uniref:hydrophobic protein n=1 Tax=Kitasatospora sp. NPDC015120 TaxID=3364023 RepID=UPI0036F46CBD